MIPVSTDISRDKLPVVTLILMGVNLLVFIFESMMPLEGLKWVVVNFGYGPSNMFNPIALITAMFLHGSLFHLVFNMLFLWVFGGPVEERVGRKLYILYYFGAGIAAAMLYVIVELIIHPGKGLPAIGASGAISGVIAIYLYRCFYSKVKMVITFIFLPRVISIPAIPLIIFWFLQDVIMGFISATTFTGVAHWAHVGGFFFGIVIGRVNRYGHEGRVEQLRRKIMQRLEDGGGWNAAEKDLTNLLKIDPNDPEVHHDMARLYATRKQLKLAAEHYQQSVQRYFIKDPLGGAYTVLEHLKELSRPMSPHYHMKAAEVLIEHSYLDDAKTVLMPVMKSKKRGPILEKLMILFIKVCRALEQNDEAEEAVQMFRENYPESRFGDEITKVLSMNSGDVFPKRDAQEDVLSEKKAKETVEREGLAFISLFEQVFTDPVFWTLLLFVNLAVPILFRSTRGPWTPVYMFILAFVLTIVHRLGSISDLIHYMSGPSENKVRAEVDLKRKYDEAMLAERGSDYEKATTLYEQLLMLDPAHVQARFNVARIYSEQLSNAARAKRHYTKLTELLPETHPFHRDAIDFIKGR
jgi:membrane associated rhomboid family serine protease